MFLGLLTLITALSISAVAIYYSVAGLVAIFAAAALPIMIMGGTLEVAKLVTAVWLHRYWKQATWWLKTYLTTAVVILMFITSMGIFGFLSKAHIEQTSASEESIARVETIQNEINRQQSIISRAENRIEELESSNTNADAGLQDQIDREQERIDNAYSRIQPAIAEQNKIIENVTSLFQQELDRIDAELATLQGYIDAGEIRKAQGMVGTATDGAYGPKTAAAFTAWQDAKRAERNDWLQKIQQAANSPTVKAARDEIARLRKTAEDQIAQSNALVNRLRNQLANTQNQDDIQKAIDEQSERIRLASLEVDSLSEEKIVLEAEYRKLEAEVGPVKYIAEFIYGEQANKGLLEEAVRWVILVIIFVFDPLAVLLLIASQYTFEIHRKRKDDQQELHRQQEWREYEQKRAQRIIDNPGYNPNTSVETQEEQIERKEQEDVKEDPVNSDGDSGDMVSKNDTTDPDDTNIELEQSEVQTDDDPENDTEEERERRRIYDEIDNQESTKSLKQSWKAEHPNENLKVYKRLYIKGKIENLPWLEENK